MRRLVPLIALCACPVALAADAIVVTSTNGLLRFDTATPGTANVVSITGIGVGDGVVGVDVRPQTREVYLVTRNGSGAGRLYRLNLDTAVAVQLPTLAADPADVTSPYTTLSASRYGVDFNPVPDRLRLVGSDGHNLRVNVDTGLVTSDADLNPGSPAVGAVAYTNNFAGATTTTLYDLDASTDALFFQNPPNNGTLVVAGALGVGNFDDTAAFDIADAPARNSAFALLTVNGTARLYTVNLTTGAAALIGSLAGNPAVAGFAVIDPGRVFANGFE